MIIYHCWIACKLYPVHEYLNTSPCLTSSDLVGLSGVGLGGGLHGVGVFSKSVD